MASCFNVNSRVVVADPHETKNLLNEYPDKAAHLRKLIEQWWSVSE